MKFVPLSKLTQQGWYVEYLLTVPVHTSYHDDITPESFVSSPRSTSYYYVDEKTKEWRVWCPPTDDDDTYMKSNDASTVNCNDRWLFGPLPLNAPSINLTGRVGKEHRVKMKTIIIDGSFVTVNVGHPSDDELEFQQRRHNLTVDELDDVYERMFLRRGLTLSQAKNVLGIGGQLYDTPLARCIYFKYEWSRDLAHRKAGMLLDDDGDVLKEMGL